MKNGLLLFLFIFLTGCTKEFILDVRVNPPNSGTVFPSEGTFKDGSTITLNAAPNVEYVFSNWSGDASGSNTSVNVTIDDNKNVVANFKLRQYELTTNVLGEGSISQTIINADKSTDYDSGTRISLKAIPAKGYYFSGWSGALTGDTNPSELIIDSPKSVTATFIKISTFLERFDGIGFENINANNEGIIDYFFRDLNAFHKRVRTDESMSYLRDEFICLKCKTFSDGYNINRCTGNPGEEIGFTVTIIENTLDRFVFSEDNFKTISSGQYAFGDAEVADLGLPYRYLHIYEVIDDATINYINTSYREYLYKDGEEEMTYEKIYPKTEIQFSSINCNGIND